MKHKLCLEQKEIFKMKHKLCFEHKEILMKQKLCLEQKEILKMKHKLCYEQKTNLKETQIVFRTKRNFQNETNLSSMLISFAMEMFPLSNSGKNVLNIFLESILIYF
jgi:hypothetical protein